MTDPDPIAALDQRREEVKTLAVLFGSYFKGLIASGFEREEAMSLIRDYQAELFEIGRDTSE